MAPENVELVRRQIEALNRGDWEGSTPSWSRSWNG
jgi:hypothetical protein